MIMAATAHRVLELSDRVDAGEHFGFGLWPSNVVIYDENGSALAMPCDRAAWGLAPPGAPN